MSRAGKARLGDHGGLDSGRQMCGTKLSDRVQLRLPFGAQLRPQVLEVAQEAPGLGDAPCLRTFGLDGGLVLGGR